MKKPPDKGPTHKTVKTSLKSVAKNDVVIEKLTKIAISTNVIVSHALRLLKLYFLDMYRQNKDFPKLDKNFIKIFLKIICEAPKQGRKRSEDTRTATSPITDFYNRYYREIQLEKVTYTHMNTVLDYVSESIVTIYENNIEQRFVTYVERYVNVKWHKRDVIETINRLKLSSDKRKHLVSKLCNNLRRVKNDLLNPTKPKSSPEMYHLWIESVKHKVLPDKQFEKDSIFYDLACYPQDYLRSMIWMTDEMEKQGVKLSNVFPLRREVIPKYVPIDTTTLVHVLMTKETGKKGESLTKGKLAENKDELWSKFFNMKKRIWHQGEDYGYRFNNFIETDGVGLSIIMVRKDMYGKRACTIRSKFGENKESYIDELEKNGMSDKNIVAIDPNKSDLIFCTDSHDKKFRYTQDQRRKETKSKKYRDIFAEKKKIRMDGKNITEWEDEISKHNSRTVNFDKFLDYCRVKNEVSKRITPFYTDRLFRKLKLGSFFMRQQTEEKMLNDFERIFGSSKNTIIGFGDYEQRQHMRYKEPVKGKGFRSLLRKRGYQVYLVDEFRTSCRCSACKGECKTFRKRISPRPWRDEEITVHGLLLCQECNKLWNRDYNASRNIHKICVEAVAGNERPRYLHRSRGPVSDATSAPVLERGSQRDFTNQNLPTGGKTTFIDLIGAGI